MHKYTARIDELRQQRGWTVYKLGKESGISAQTIHNWMSTDRCPQIPFIEEICNALKITLAQFFTHGYMIEITKDTKSLYDEFWSLTPEQRDVVVNVMRGFSSTNRQ